MAELGSVSVEFYYLSKHTQDPEFQRKADKIYDSVSKATKMDGLLRSILDVRTGESKSGTFTFAGCADSYYEYLLKAWILTGKKNTVLFMIALKYRNSRRCIMRQLKEWSIIC